MAFARGQPLPRARAAQGQRSQWCDPADYTFRGQEQIKNQSKKRKSKKENYLKVGYGGE